MWENYHYVEYLKSSFMSHAQKVKICRWKPKGVKLIHLDLNFYQINFSLLIGSNSQHLLWNFPRVTLLIVLASTDTKSIHLQCYKTLKKQQHGFEALFHIKKKKKLLRFFYPSYCLHETMDSFRVPHL